MSAAPAIVRPPDGVRTAGRTGRQADGRLATWKALGLATPALICVAALFLLPIVRLVWLSFTVSGRMSFANYRTFFTTPGYVHSLEVTLYISALTVAVCALIGYPLALAITRVGSRMSSVMLALTVVPFWSSLLILGFIWEVLLAPGGQVQRALASLGLISASTDLAHTTLGLVLGLSQYMLPFMVLPVVAAMRAIDPALARAARALGATSWQTFWRVTFPLSIPGVIPGGMLVFLIALGSYVLPALLGPPSDTFLAQVIEVQVDQVLNWGVASAMAVVLVVVAVAIFAIYVKLFGLRRGFGGQ